MKKVAFSIIALIILISSGCVKSNNTTTTTSKQGNENPSTQANTKRIESSFFFKSDVSQVNYQGTFMYNDFVQKDVKLHINEVANLKYGKWYELKLASINGVPNDQLSLGYFFAEKDTIYHLDANEKNLNKIKTNEKLPNDCVIVCQDTELKDPLNKDEPGWHQYIIVNGDTREFHSYNSKVETGYYETFYWEKNKGLIHFRRGFGAERDAIELNITQKNNKDLTPDEALNIAKKLFRENWVYRYEQKAEINGVNYYQFSWGDGHGDSDSLICIDVKTGKVYLLYPDGFCL